MTRIRKKVLEKVTSSENPITADEIYRSLYKHANLATIYRALNWLEDAGYITSIAFGSGPRYFFPKARHYHFLICELCGKIQAIKECNLASSRADLEEHYGFIVLDHVLYFRGICKDCKKVRR